MSTALSPVATPALPEKFANPLTQVRGLLANPAVRRAGPAALLVALLGAVALAWMTLAQPPQRVLFQTLADADKAAVTQALDAANIANTVDGSGSITVAEDDYHKARMLLASQDLPKAAPGGYAILDQLPMGVSRAVEGERLRQARETELARSIEEIDAVAEARVHLAMPEASVFVRDRAQPSASVIVKLQPGRALSDSQVRSIVNLVAASVPGMPADGVTVVDQQGALLTKKGDGEGNAAGDQRIDYQRRMEDKVRQQLSQLLTPLVGDGNFTAEVQADVDLDETQATRESYDKDGAVRAEQGSWTGQKAGEQVPGGIPGALSNTPPPPSTLATPTPAPTPGAEGAAAAGTPGAAMPDAMKASDSFTRSYDLGRQVSVTRGAPGAIKRLSVAVVLKEEGGKPRSAAEIRQLTELVRAAVGFDAGRNDQVAVVSRAFAAPAMGEDGGRAWYDNSWMPVVARNATALVIALLVLFLGIRPLTKAVLKKKEEAEAAPAAADGRPQRFNAAAAAREDGEGPVIETSAPVSIEMLDSARSFDDRVGMVRGFTRDNPTRAALAVRDMIKADAR